MLVFISYTVYYISMYYAVLVLLYIRYTVYCKYPQAWVVGYICTNNLTKMNFSLINNKKKNLIGFFKTIKYAEH